MIGGTRVEAGQQASFGICRGQGIGQRARVVRGQALQGGDIQPQPALHRGGIEQIGVVLALEHAALPSIWLTLRNSSKFSKLRGFAAHARHAANRPTARSRSMRRVEVEQHRHQRQPARIARQLQLLQQARRRCSAGARRRRACARARGLQERVERLARCRTQTHRQQVHAVPDQIVMTARRPGRPRERRRPRPTCPVRRPSSAPNSPNKAANRLLPWRARQLAHGPATSAASITRSSRRDAKLRAGRRGRSVGRSSTACRPPSKHADSQ